MNTGFLGPAVATVLTACGIETDYELAEGDGKFIITLQQYLPLAVLKLHFINTAPNTVSCNSTYRLRY